MSQENPIVKAGQWLNSEPRAIYLLVFIICFAGALAPWQAPNLPADQWSRDVYNQVEKLNPGDVVYILFATFPANERANFIGINAFFKQVWARGAGTLVFTTSAETQTIMDTIFYWVLLNVTNTDAEKTAPLYGTQFVDLGYVPQTREGAVYGMAANTRAVTKSDKFGTLLDNLPMMKNVNKGNDYKLVVTFGSGGPPACWTVPIGAFWLAYGVPCMGIGEGEVYTEAAYLKQAGLLKGLSGAAWGQRQYQQLVIDQYKIAPNTAMGSTASQTTQLLYIGLFVVAVMIIHNVYSLGMKRRES